jgi:hypothetical protein
MARVSPFGNRQGGGCYKRCQTREHGRIRCHTVSAPHVGAIRSATHGGTRHGSADAPVTSRWPLPPPGQSPTLPHLVTQEEANENEHNDDSSGQRLPGTSACLHASILAAALGQVYSRVHLLLVDMTGPAAYGSQMPPFGFARARVRNSRSAGCSQNTITEGGCLRRTVDSFVAPL